MMRALWLAAALLLAGGATARAVPCFPQDYGTVAAGTVISNEAGYAGCPVPNTYTSAQASPGNPTGTTSTAAAVMMGLAGSVTPKASGKVLIEISGNVTNNTINDGATVQISYGTGTAPTNAAALTGTQAGNIARFTAAAAAQKVPFSCQVIVSGLTVGTAYWLDVAVAAVTGGTATVTDISITAYELP